MIDPNLRLGALRRRQNKPFEIMRMASPKPRPWAIRPAPQPCQAGKADTSGPRSPMHPVIRCGASRSGCRFKLRVALTEAALTLEAEAGSRPPVVARGI